MKIRLDSWPIRFLTKVCDLTILNVLFILGCVTIVFSGAAVTALYSVTLKMIQGKAYAPLKDSLRAARENFIPSVPATILLFVDIMLITFLDTVLYAEVLLISPSLFVALVIAALVLTALLSWLFPLLAQFDNTFPRHFGNAAKLALANLPVTFLVTLMDLLPLLLALLLPELVFEDRFDAPALDRSHWNVELHEPGWVNEELQEYVDTPDVIRLEGGKLMIHPVKTVHEGGSVSYTSGRVSTQHKYDFTYGIFEARLKVSKGKGFLPAFWLMATDEERYGRWPVCGEIDIMEIMGQDTRKNYGTIHYGLPHGQNQGAVTLAEGDFAEEFHDFTPQWEPRTLRWYVDGRLFHKASRWYSAGADGTPKPYPAPFNHDMYIILNLAVGGNWVGWRGWRFQPRPICTRQLWRGIDHLSTISSGHCLRNGDATVRTHIKKIRKNCQRWSLTRS